MQLEYMQEQQQGQEQDLWEVQAKQLEYQQECVEEST
jgi:hypothetical protein